MFTELCHSLQSCFSEIRFFSFATFSLPRSVLLMCVSVHSTPILLNCLRCARDPCAQVIQLYFTCCIHLHFHIRHNSRWKVWSSHSVVNVHPFICGVQAAFSWLPRVPRSTATIGQRSVSFWAGKLGWEVSRNHTSSRPALRDRRVVKRLPSFQLVCVFHGVSLLGSGISACVGVQSG